jgi:hypothetical protein
MGHTLSGACLFPERLRALAHAVSTPGALPCSMLLAGSIRLVRLLAALVKDSLRVRHLSQGFGQAELSLNARKPNRSVSTAHLRKPFYASPKALNRAGRVTEIGSDGSAIKMAIFHLSCLVNAEPTLPLPRARDLASIRSSVPPGKD